MVLTSIPIFTGIWIRLINMMQKHTKSMLWRRPAHYLPMHLHQQECIYEPCTVHMSVHACCWHAHGYAMSICTCTYQEEQIPYTCTYIYIYIYIVHSRAFVYAYACRRLHTGIYMHIRTYVCSVYMCAYIYTYLHAHVYLHIHKKHSHNLTYSLVEM